MFNRDDSFLDPSLYHEESSVRKKFHINNHASIHNNPCVDEFSFKLNYSQQITDKSQTQYQSSSSTMSLRENLEQMEKHDIIELLIEEVKYTQQTKEKHVNSRTEKQNGQIFLKSNGNSSESINFKMKYENLVKDFEEYINNTIEAQNHFVKTIEELKKQNRDLKISSTNPTKQHPNKRYLNPNSSHSQPSNKQKNGIVEKLQQTIEKYLEINNELIGKVEKLQRLKHEDDQQIAKLKKVVQKLQFECDTLDKDNQNLLNQNDNFRTIIEELKLYIKEKRQAKDMLNSCDGFLNSGEASIDVISQRVKNLKSNRPHDLILEISQIQHKPTHSPKGGKISPSNLKKTNQSESNLSFQSGSHQQIVDNENLKSIMIQNKELRQINMNLEEIIEKKSQKIRKLLQQIQQMSEEKLNMKREILKLKNSNKESPKGSETKQGQNINDVLNGTSGEKMVSSSIYSLKNSQSTCLETSKGPKNDENKKPESSQKRSAIRQAYNNCFKKQSENSWMGKEESAFKIKSEMTKIESSYMPRALDFSNKKSSVQEEFINMLENSPKSDVY